MDACSILFASQYSKKEHTPYVFPHIPHILFNLCNAQLAQLVTLHIS
jgi:hypothetical protein